MMAKKKKKTGGGGNALGNALLNAGNAPKTRKKAVHKHTMDVGTTHKLASCVERSDLDEFVSMAVMEQRSFEADRGRVLVLGKDAVPERSVLQPEIYEYENLTIPRRPKWDETTTPEELDEAERLSFVNWRRELARRAESSSLAVTPYEKNIEVWRQLWRVMERSDLIVQIVDSRNPLLFLCQDVTNAVEEIDSNKQTLVIVNKADFLSPRMREYWVHYFRSKGIRCVFFSALEEQHRQAAEVLAQAEREEVEAALRNNDNESSSSEYEEETVETCDVIEESEPASTEDVSPRVRQETDLLSTTELIDYLVESYRDSVESAVESRPITIGLVGYPNVGKSSIINALLGEKKVGVAAMPGKTRHFQTLILRDDITLCDCPGLVFPVFLNSKADLVCNGILPIDRLREYLSPVHLVCSHVSASQFLSQYGLRFPTDVDKVEPHALLQEFARVRGFITGRGLPDEARAARYILKDFTVGRLLYCHPPPGLSSEQMEEFLSSLVPMEAPSQRSILPSRPFPASGPSKDNMFDEARGARTDGMAFSGCAKGARKLIAQERARAKALLRGKQEDRDKKNRKAKNSKARNVIAVSNY